MSYILTFLIFALFLALFGVIDFYLSKKLHTIISFAAPKAPFWISLAFIIAVTLIIIFGFMRSLLPLNNGLKEFLKIASSYLMGIFLYLLFFTLLCDGVLLLLKLTKLVSVTAKLRFFASLLSIVLTATVSLYGFLNVGTPKNTYYKITLSDTETKDLKIIMLSDLHLGSVKSESRLPEIVAAINAQRPDIICIAGDFFDSDFTAIKNPLAAQKTLKKLSATYGVFACLGNHDAGATFDDMLDFLNECNITALNDAYTIIDDHLILVGRLDSSPIGSTNEFKRKELKEILGNLTDSPEPIVVMDHNPQNYDSYNNKTDLVLSGHTHKGQLFPGNLLTGLMYTVDYGYYKAENSPHIVVSSGVGTWGPPMRVGTSCEIVTIDLIL